MKTLEDNETKDMKNDFIIRKIEINYNWNLEDYPELPHEKREILEGEAEKLIYEMRKEYYTCGELHYEDNQISVYGWWSFSYVKPN